METRDRRASAGSAAPSSKGAASTVQSVFHRQVLPGRAFAASIWREPATEFAALPPRSRLPTLLRPLPLSRWRARPKPNQGLLTHDRRGPRAACRFLQPIRPTSTTAQSSKPRPPRPWSPTCAAVRFHEPRFLKRSTNLGPWNIPRTWVRGAERGWPCFEAQPTEISRARGLRGLAPSRGSPRRDRSRWRLHPNPIDSNTSCRELVTIQVGVACTAGALQMERPGYAPASEPRLRRTRR
jgi:hypothetical protein